eukprot:TRINITY_DN4630_c0_g1_i2.p2 TRINITY_DN4630_c0_g1~~TRINITY_DN4630_c0_g1_i2.p2  ORF type:complete len:349 (+),score=70.79 TRINITY_DN4630_c0_g1_i2:367-1413(+)
MFLLAMDHCHTADGKADKPHTGLYVPNEYVYEIAQKYPDYFIPVVSIHPYRKDALEQLKKWHEKGVRLVKWLPNSQAINPSSKKCIPFYKALIEHKMVLLSHTGQEHSIDVGGLIQKYGNPLRLRVPLDLGVKVIAAHCASEGTDIDRDSKDNKRMSSFDLFIRMMDESKYDGLLFADISAVTAFKRLGHPLTTILNRTDLHHRLVFGSDYPVPAINFVVQTSALVRNRYITEEDRTALNEIYAINPLLFDLMTKLLIKSPDKGNRFSRKVFQPNPSLPLYPKGATKGSVENEDEEEEEEEQEETKVTKEKEEETEEAEEKEITEIKAEETQNKTPDDNAVVGESNST